MILVDAVGIVLTGVVTDGIVGVVFPVGEPLEPPHPPPQAVSPSTSAVVIHFFSKKNLFLGEIDTDLGFVI